MNTFKTTTVAAALCAFAATGVCAQASGDGRQGPRVFSDSALDQSLVAMNSFLQKRYAHEDIMASLHETAPESDFRALAQTVSDVPEFRAIETAARFGSEIDGGSGLDIYLANFNEDLAMREDPLFVRIARAAGGTEIDFSEVAAIPPEASDLAAFGPEIHDDVTLDDHMLSLFDHMLAHTERDAALTASRPDAVSGGSFDRYGEALKLF